MSVLKDTNIIKNESKVSEIFENLTSKPFTTIKYDKPHDYIHYYWDRYIKFTWTTTSEKSVNGAIFELIIYTLLHREQILPFYTQAKVAFVPNIEFDTILYSKASPICLSLKTSLRERYKQADLEAIALKYVHRKAKCYLLTLSEKEAESVRKKIGIGDIIGLDDVIDCNNSQIDNLITELKKYKFTESTSIDIVTGNLIK